MRNCLFLRARGWGIDRQVRTKLQIPGGVPGGGMVTGRIEPCIILDKKHLIYINGKKKFKRILVEGEKFKLRKLHSKDFIALFSSRRRVCPVLKHNRVSEVFKRSKVHNFEYYDERNYVLKCKFDLCH